ncbi:hypothetical protein C1I98_38935, partial [Spongiactinospora gelatinilytica]
MSTNEPNEQGQERPDGWTQFGKVPPRAGGFPGRATPAGPPQEQERGEAAPGGDTAVFASPSGPGGSAGTPGPGPGQETTVVPGKAKGGFSGRQKALAGLALAAVALGGG